MERRLPQEINLKGRFSNTLSGNRACICGSDLTARRSPLRERGHRPTFDRERRVALVYLHGRRGMPVEVTKEHQWLARMVGEWTYEMEAEAEPGQPPIRDSGPESVRALGDAWVI